MTNTTGREPDALRSALEQLAEHGTPPPGTAPVFDVGTEGFIKFFRNEVLEQLVAPGGATCRFFEGSYGSGKTHLLQLLENQAREQRMAVVWIDLSQALSLQDWRQITRFFLENVTVTFDRDVIRGLPNILERLGRIPIVNAHELEVAMLPHPGFKAAMMCALHPEALSDEASSRLAGYLMGQRVGAGILRRLNVFGVKNPLSARNAEQVLNTVLGGLHCLGLPGTMLLFDENESSFDVRYAYSRRVRLAANLMRRLIDACFTGGLTGTAAVFAVLPGFLEACSMVYPALGQRVQVVRDGRYQPAWRWPVLSVEAVSSVETPEEFLSEAIKALLDIVQRCQRDVAGLGARMQREGQRVLRANAGSGYRRALVKALAATAIERL